MCVDAATADWLSGDASPVSGDDDATERTSWWPKDLAIVLAGGDPEPAPEFLQRLDGVSLFYQGKVNGLIGESESGKTWVALLAALQALQARQRVLYLDFEDTAAGIVSRLRSMGASDDDLACLAYVGPDEDLSDNAKRDLREAINDAPPDLIVMDGFNAAMALMGLELTDNTDATRFSQQLLKPLAATGACVVYVDHVPKSKDNRGKGGIGAQAKRAMTTGCAIAVDVVEPFGRGMTGRLRLTVDKDRPGHVRAASVEAKGAGTAVLVSGDDGSVQVQIEREFTAAEQRSFIQERLRADILAKTTAYGSQGATRAEIAGDVGKKQEDIKADLDDLVALGQLVEVPGKQRSRYPRLAVNQDPNQQTWDASW